MQPDKNLILKYYRVIFTLLVFINYLFTLAPSVVQIDAGELATVQITLGIAHPTGYPLFTMLGHLFLLLPLPLTKIMQANLLAAIWCALGVLFFLKSAELIFNNLNFTLPKEKEKKKKAVRETPAISGSPSDNSAKLFSIVAGGIALAFGTTYWFQSTSVEVYSLQIFLFMLNIFLMLKAYYNANLKMKDWFYISVSLALGFANHMTTVLLLPFITVIFFKKEKFSLNSIKKIILMLLVFFPLLIAFYLYLPLRAATNPALNWGNPVNLENILRHVSGKQYQVWLFESFQAAGKQFRYFVSNFPSEFGYTGLLLGLAGILFGFRKAGTIFYALTSTLLFTILYSINYDISDIDSYFLLAYIMFSFFVMLGFYSFFSKLSKHFRGRISFIIILILSILPLAINFGKVNQSGIYTYENYTKSILNSVENNSTIMSYQWDYFVSPSYYFQNVEGYRKDVTVIDKELLRRSWYYNQLNGSHPHLFDKMKKEVEDFLTAVKPFERSERFDSDIIENCYRTVLTKLISAGLERGNFYIGEELFQNEMQRGELKLPEGYRIVPHLFLFKVVKGEDYVAAPDPDYTIKFSAEGNKYRESMKDLIYNMLIYRSYYELQYNRPDRAKIYIGKIRKDFPDHLIPNNLLNAIN